MKFDMNIFLSIAILALVQASEEEVSAEERKLQVNGHGYSAPHGNDSGYDSYRDPYSYGNTGYNPYGYKNLGTKGKKGKGKKGKSQNEYGRPKYGMENDKKHDSGYGRPYNYHGRAKSGMEYAYKENDIQNECARAHCDFFFDAVNKHSGSYGSYFTREDCKWDPTPMMQSQCPDWSTMDCKKLEACTCYWKSEEQCKLNLLPEFQHPQVPPDESELELALQAFPLIENDMRYATKVAPKLEECFSDSVYACLCNPELNEFLPKAEEMFVADSCPGLNIVDNQVVSDSITVEGSAGCDVSDISVEINIDHTFIGDLEITLTHEETGTSVNMWNGQCGGSVDMSVLFVDGGTQTLCVAISDPVAVPVDPTVSGLGPAFSTFSGESVAGTWRLDVEDTFSGDNGSLNFWILNIDALCTCQEERLPTTLCADSQTELPDFVPDPQDLNSGARLGDPSSVKPSPET